MTDHSPHDRADHFEQIFLRHVDPVRRFLVRRGTAADTEDLVAATFLTAWRRIDRIPAGHELAWLYRVAAHHLANHRRGQRRHDALIERVAAHAEPPPALPEPDQIDPAIARAMAHLPAADRQLLELMAWEELEGDRLALALGVSRATLRMRIHRARRRMRAALQRERPDYTPHPHERPQETSP